MALLDIVQRAMRRAGFAVPSTVVANTDPVVQDFFDFVNEDGYELSLAANWQQLRREATFTTLAAEIQATLPSDFDRFVNDTFWNRTEQDRLVGPVSPMEWAALKASVAAAVDNYFVYREGNILFYPVPPAGQTCAYEYVSQNWAKASGGTLKASMTVDTDTALLPERLLSLGTLWRFKKAKGLPFEAELAEWQARRAVEIAQSEPRATLNMVGRMGNSYPGDRRIPEGSWPL